ncbi:MAG TPA: hypothetical protein EYP69_04635 [Bacteroidales bacterium]|nr:hypothetical protein [Bacteroidales bacterium]
MRKSFLLLLILLYATVANTQNLINSGDLIQGGIDDGVKLINAYILPLNRAMMVGMNNTSYTRIHNYDDNKHFNISIRTSFVSIPVADQSFDVDKLDLENMHPEDPNNTIAQTVFGDSLAHITLVSNQETYDTTNNFPLIVEKKPLFKINTIPGCGYHVMPIPYFNTGYKIKYTNFSVGFIPWVTIPKSDVRVVLYSLSVQQDLAWFIKGLQNKPLSISLQGGYYHFYAHADLNVQPEDVDFTVPLSSNNSTGPYDNQEIKINYNSIFISGIISYNFKRFFSIYGLAGYNIGTSHIQVLGNYPVYVTDPSGNASLSLEDIVDPMDETDTYDRVKFTGGLQVDFFKRFYLQANYTYANYGGFGMAIGFRF